LPKIDCSFDTLRLSATDWHSAMAAPKDGRSLAETVQALLTPAVTAPLPEAWQGPYSETRAEEWIRDRDAKGTTLLITSTDSGQSVGLVFLHESERLHPGKLELRLGYLIADSQWGKGYATELVSGLTNWAQERPYGSIVAGVSSQNTRSRRVLEKCGFSRVSDSGSDEPFYALCLRGQVPVE